MKRAAILAGGLGTRLRSVVKDVPKSLAPIHGKPFLFLLIEHLKQCGIQDIILLTGYMHDKIQAACEDGSQWGVNIFYSQEHEPLGTAGALKHAEKFLKEDTEFLVMNGDSYAPAAVNLLIHQHLTASQLGIIAASHVKDASRFGTITFDAHHKILAFQEKSLAVHSGYVNAGVYLLSNQIFKDIPVNQNVSLEYDIFPKLLKQQPGCLSIAVLQQGFEDIGLPESYAAFSDKKGDA